MEFLNEFPEMIFRWLHILFAIMWVGNSIFFKWLETHLLPCKEKKEDVEGELWMLHGGGFFHVEKRPVIPGKLPKSIHWFKWEAYSTWITGFLLLSIVYYFSGGVFLVNPASEIGTPWAVHLGLGVLIVGWIVYDDLWRSPVGDMGKFPIIISVALLLILAFFLEYFFQGRGMYIHIGALLGTCMAGNVFFHIIPSQKKMMEAAEGGDTPDPEFSKRAMQRSKHNNYITFPVIFLMISSHFPSTYGNAYPWLILAILILGSATVKHCMNLPKTNNDWLGDTIFAAVITLMLLVFVIWNTVAPGQEIQLWAFITEILNLLGRWVHVIFGIMWIGNSLFFNWMDLALQPPEKPRDNILGELWMLHGGVFFFVEKRALTPGFIPNPLHWFKYEAYFTWISGFFLLWVVYYLSGGTYLIDPEIYPLGIGSGISIGLGVLIFGWLLYDFIWKTDIVEEPQLGTVVSCLILVAIAFALTHLLGSRAAFLHIGALLGTLMAGNVFFHIIPSQKRMMAAVEANQAPDPDWGTNAKYRSKHNNYMTFPLLFTMISNHFPATYGHELNWLILTALFLISAMIKHLLNIPHLTTQYLNLAREKLLGFLEVEEKREGTISFYDRLVVFFCAGVFILFIASQIPPLTVGTSATTERAQASVSFSKVKSIIDKRCTTCHSANPSDPSVPVPAGVFFDDPAAIQKFSPRIKARAVDSKTMPLGNKTGMSDEERTIIGEWIRAGSPLN